MQPIEPRPRRLMFLGLALSLCTTLLAAAQDPEQLPAGRSHFLGREVAQTMHWTGAPWLLRATREDEENGVLLRKWLAVQPGQAVCDLGCGNGYHTLPIAEAVGQKGTVYAVELQPQMLELLSLRAKPRGLDNLRYVECTIDDPKLPVASCDLVLLVDVYHELSHPVRVMGHVRRALKPGGRVVLVEFRAEDPAVPIKPEHTMTKAQMVREMAEHGFAPVDDYDRLPWQHAMSFVPVAADARLGARQVLRGFLKARAGTDERVLLPFLRRGVAAADVPELGADCRAELRAGPGGSVIAALQGPSGQPLPESGSEVVLGRDDEQRWFVQAVRQPTPAVRAHGSLRPFVAMHTGTGGGPIEPQVKLVQELGFDGLAWDLDHLAEVRQACEQRGMDVYSAYAVLDLPAADEDGKALDRRLAPLQQAMQELAGGPGMLWLAVRDEGGNDERARPAALAVLRRLGDISRATGVEVALYPHHGFWLATVEQALTLCGEVNEPSLGICFNLCHWLRSTDTTDARPAIESCGASLLAATVNGADVAGQDWNTLIRPLGEGDHPLAQFLAGLDAAHFAGPVGLQGFGLTSPPREHLTRSMAAWRAAHQR